MHPYYLEHNRFPKDFIADYYRRAERNAISRDNPASDPHGQALDNDPPGTNDDAAPTPSHARSVGVAALPAARRMTNRVLLRGNASVDLLRGF